MTRRPSRFSTTTSSESARAPARQGRAGRREAARHLRRARRARPTRSRMRSSRAASSAATAWSSSPTTPSRRWSSFWAVLKANAVRLDRQPADQGRQARRTCSTTAARRALDHRRAPRRRLRDGRAASPHLAPSSSRAIGDASSSALPASLPGTTRSRRARRAAAAAQHRHRPRGDHLHLGLAPAIPRA